MNARITISHRTDALLAIDVQPTFMPGGELPVGDGDAVVPAIRRLLPGFGIVVATQDWHPRDHVSFAANNPGRNPFETIELPYGTQVLWPVHGLAGSPTARLAMPELEARADVIVRKGTRRDVDSYSAFMEADRTTRTGLAGWLRERGVARVFLCGLATDYCVNWSAIDAVDAGFETVVLSDACRGIAAGDALEPTWTALRAKGVRIAAVTDLEPCAVDAA